MTSQFFTSAVAAILLFSTANAATSTTVECRALVNGKEEALSVKLSQGKIGYWKKNVIAKTDKNGAFYIFAEDVEEFGFESLKSFKAPNGYSIVQVISTMEAASLGVSADRTKGFYKYEDLGSGNGNKTIVLSCKEIL